MAQDGSALPQPAAVGTRKRGDLVVGVEADEPVLQHNDCTAPHRHFKCRIFTRCTAGLLSPRVSSRGGDSPATAPTQWYFTGAVAEGVPGELRCYHCPEWGGDRIKHSLLFSALYAKCPYYTVLCMRSAGSGMSHLHLLALHDVDHLKFVVQLLFLDVQDATQRVAGHRVVVQHAAGLLVAAVRGRGQLRRGLACTCPLATVREPAM